MGENQLKFAEKWVKMAKWSSELVRNPYDDGDAGRRREFLYSVKEEEKGEELFWCG